MPTKSTKISNEAGTRPKLKDGEEAWVEWLHSSAGQKAETVARRKRAERPVITVETPLTPSEMREVIRKTGANVHMTRGFTEKPNNPAIVEAIISRATAKQTTPISIRIPVADLNAVKQLAGRSGIRYQTILKDLIHEGLHSRDSQLAGTVGPGAKPAIPPKTTGRA